MVLFYNFNTFFEANSLKLLLNWISVHNKVITEAVKIYLVFQIKKVQCVLNEYTNKYILDTMRN